MQTVCMEASKFADRGDQEYLNPTEAAHKVGEVKETLYGGGLLLFYLSAILNDYCHSIWNEASSESPMNHF